MSNYVNTGKENWNWWKKHKESVEKDRANKTGSWSSFWMNDYDSDDFFTGDSSIDKDKKETVSSGHIKGAGRGNYNLHKIAKLAGVRRAVSNFVTILTGRDDIKVRFSGGRDSYTDGEVVTISAESDPKHFDSMVGIALHEAAHCVHSNTLLRWPLLLENTDTKFLSEKVEFEVFDDLIWKWYSEFVKENKDQLSDSVRGMTKKQISDYCWGLVNVIEDRRIDNLVYTRASGYRPYYKAMYDKFWDNKNISNQLLINPKYRMKTMEAYDYRIINISNGVTSFTKDALPQLDKIIDLIDINTIDRLTIKSGKYKGQADLRELLKLVTEVTSIILLNSDEIVDSSGRSRPCHQPASTGSDGLPNFDISSSNQITVSDELLKEIGKAIGSGRKWRLPSQSKVEKGDKKLEKELKDQLKNDYKKKKITTGMAKLLDTVESSGIKMENLTWQSDNPYHNTTTVKQPYIKVDTMSESLIRSGLVSFMRPSALDNLNNVNAVAHGRRLGEILSNKILVRNESNITKYSRKKLGKIDRRLIHQLGTDIHNIFYKTTVDSHTPVLIHLSIDASGSMGGYNYYGNESTSTKWYKSIVLATALAYAAKKIDNFDVTISFRYYDRVIYLVNLYDSRKHSYSYYKKWAERMHTMGSTPESLCYEIEIDDMLDEKTTDKEVYFLTITDGAPGISGQYGGETAQKHVKKTVRRMEELGIKPMAYFVGSNYDLGYYGPRFKSAYGEYGEMIDITNFGQIAKTINKLLLK